MMHGTTNIKFYNLDVLRRFNVIYAVSLTNLDTHTFYLFFWSFSLSK